MVLRFTVTLLALVSLQAFAQEQGSSIKQPPSWPSAAQHAGTGSAPDDAAKHSQEWSAATPPASSARGVDTPAPGLPNAALQNSDATGSRSASAGLAPGHYTVQVAAFRDKSAAKRAIKESTAAGMRMVQSQRNGEDWYLLILGVYPTREAAEQAEAKYLEANPRGGTWIRLADSID